MKFFACLGLELKWKVFWGPIKGAFVPLFVSKKLISEIGAFDFETSYLSILISNVSEVNALWDASVAYQPL